MYNQELYHYGVKGMKWGVRKAIYKTRRKEAAKVKKAVLKTGVGRGIADETGKYYGRLKAINESSKEYKKQLSGVTTNKQRVNAYQNIMNNISEGVATSTIHAYKSKEKLEDAVDRLNKLHSKPYSDKRRKKIEKLTKKAKVLKTNVDDAATIYREYKKVADIYVKRMEQDNAVVYRTKKGETGSDWVRNTRYSVRGTRYKVKESTEKRQASKKYSDPYNKQTYKDTLTKTTYYHYYY